MPRRSIVSAAERESLLALPDTKDELIRHYTFSEADLSLIRQRRGDANRLGVAVQLCLLRFPGQGLLPDATVPLSFLQWIGRQLRTDPACWPHMPSAKRPGASICSNCVLTWAWSRSAWRTIGRLSM